MWRHLIVIVQQKPTKGFHWIRIEQATMQQQIQAKEKP